MWDEDEFIILAVKWNWYFYVFVGNLLKKYEILTFVNSYCIWEEIKREILLTIDKYQ